MPADVSEAASAEVFKCKFDAYACSVSVVSTKNFFMIEDTLLVIPEPLIDHVWCLSFFLFFLNLFMNVLLCIPPFIFFLPLVAFFLSLLIP